MAPSDDLAARRRPATAERLTVETTRWLSELPVSARPERLARQFPRIANAISRQWRSPAFCLAYLDELLIDKRGDRRGFPLEILLELAALKSHFLSAVHPAPQTIWGEVLQRSRER
jgi:hypothetical protein